MLNKISIQKIAFVYILCLVQLVSAWSFWGFGRNNTPEPQSAQEELFEPDEQDQEREQDQEEQEPDTQELEFEPEPERLYTPVTILLDPAGDAQTPGRTIDDSFERSLTLHCAQQIKALLENQYARRNVKIMLTRFAGDTLEPFQAAELANKLSVDVYLRLQFYASKQVPHPVHIYYFTYTPDLDSKDISNNHTKELAFYPYHQAYMLRIQQTKQYAQLCFQILEKNKLACQPIKGLPFKPLLGITAPAFACEMALHKKDDWKHIVEPLANTLGTIIDQLQTESTVS